jgi:hypothetical protein
MISELSLAAAGANPEVLTVNDAERRDYRTITDGEVLATRLTDDLRSGDSRSGRYFTRRAKPRAI